MIISCEFVLSFLMPCGKYRKKIDRERIVGRQEKRRKREHEQTRRCGTELIEFKGRNRRRHFIPVSDANPMIIFECQLRQNESMAEMRAPIQSDSQLRPSPAPSKLRH
jgi:hypothetical protein